MSEENIPPQFIDETTTSPIESFPVESPQTVDETYDNFISDFVSTARVDLQQFVVEFQDCQTTVQENYKVFEDVISKECLFEDEQSKELDVLEDMLDESTVESVKAEVDTLKVSMQTIMDSYKNKVMKNNKKAEEISQKYEKSIEELNDIKGNMQTIDTSVHDVMNFVKQYKKT
jgi:methyl-accepting chemotaxis protein